MHFYLYFFSYIFRAKTRQRLLFIAIVGLFISSFSLVVLQGIMGGLQNGLMDRSKQALGHGFIDLVDMRASEYKDALALLDKNKVKHIREYEIELMVNHSTRVRPVIVHGIDFKHGSPEFLNDKDKSGVIVGSDLATSLNSYFDSELSLISPAHIDYLVSPIPRRVSEKISDFYVSELSEIDSVHAWTRLSLIQNLIRKRLINKIVFYSEKDFKNARKLLAPLGFKIISWEKMNSSLVWALSLETNVMLFLFIGMSFLVAICITSGFLIFFDKIKTDLISYWIMGKSQKSIYKMSYVFTHFVSFLFCFFGILMGLLFLYLLKNNDINFMPDFFVERQIPVQIDAFKILISFIIPYTVSVVFSYFSFASFKKETGSFIRVIRSV